MLFDYCEKWFHLVNPRTRATIVYAIMKLPLYVLILGMILTYCVTYQYQHDAFALINNNASQIKEGFSLYHSPKLGIEIAYPSDWSVEESQMKEVYINAPTSTQSKIDNKTETIEEAIEKAKSVL